MEDRLCAYSRAVSHFPTAVKEVNTLNPMRAYMVYITLFFSINKPPVLLQFKWRNGWFYSLSKKAIAAGKPDPCPLHTAWLKELNVVQD